MIERVYTNGAPKAIGPYSQGIIAGDFVFVSGQIPIDPETGKIIDSYIEEQAHRAIKNVRAVLEAAGSCLENVVKVTVYLTNMDDFDGMNRVYAKYFYHKPARSTVQAAKLPKDVKIEIDVIALI